MLRAGDIVWCFSNRPADNDIIAIFIKKNSVFCHNVSIQIMIFYKLSKQHNFFDSWPCLALISCCAAFLTVYIDNICSVRHNKQDVTCLKMNLDHLTAITRVADLADGTNDKRACSHYHILTYHSQLTHKNSMQTVIWFDSTPTSTSHCHCFLHHLICCAKQFSIWLCQCSVVIKNVILIKNGVTLFKPRQGAMAVRIHNQYWYLAFE